ncbi:Zinc finger C2H2-type, partial [Trinorchestia longiramus]
SQHYPDHASKLIPFDLLPPCPSTCDPRMSYACPVCTKEFPDKKDFRRHYMIHTGEKPYPCPHCPYRARIMSGLKRHIASRH